MSCKYCWSGHTFLRREASTSKRVLVHTLGKQKKKQKESSRLKDACTHVHQALLIDDHPRIINVSSVATYLDANQKI